MRMVAGVRFTEQEFKRMEFCRHLIARGVIADDDRVYREIPLAGMAIVGEDGESVQILTGGVIYVREDRPKRRYNRSGQ